MVYSRMPLHSVKDHEACTQDLCYYRTLEHTKVEESVGMSGMVIKQKLR